MAKSKDGKDSEFYLGQIRKLKAENRNLKKRLKHLERREHAFEISDDDEDVPDLPIGNQEKIIICDECFKGHFDEFEIMGKIFLTCTTCGHRKRLK